MGFSVDADGKHIFRALEMTSSLKEFYIGIRLFYCLFKILHHLIVTLILESDSLMHFFFFNL